jgi:glycosyltransferase involved in cell wall biosynthesis
VKRYKVALIHNIISPYRVPLFEELANQQSLELFVYYCSITDKNRKWNVIQSKKYNYRILPGSKIEFADKTFSFNPIILKELTINNYDAVIIGGNSDFTMQLAFLFSKMKRHPIILWSEGIESAQSLLGKMANPLTDAIIKKSDAIIVPGTQSREFHLKRGASPDNIFIAPNIIDNNSYMTKSKNYRNHSSRIKNELKLSHSRIILSVGQLIERKGVSYLLDAYYRLKKETEIDACLVIIGDGPLKGDLKRKCIERNIKDVYFLGWVSEEDKIKFYGISDLFVLPTLKDVWGLVVNEAMACGLPVISTNAAGCAIDMVVPGENGYIIESADIDQIFESMKKILLGDTIHMGINSQNRIIEHFSSQKAIEGFTSAIEFALANNI